MQMNVAEAKGKLSQLLALSIQVRRLSSRAVGFRLSALFRWQEQASVWACWKGS